MRMTLLLTALPFLMACESHPAIEAQLAPFALAFERECAARSVNCHTDRISLVFIKAPGTALGGQCVLYKTLLGTINKRIEVNYNAWITLSKDRQEELIFHEYGHCALGREHLDTLLPNRQPVSIMTPRLNTGSYYALNRNYYVNELFTGIL